MELTKIDYNGGVIWVDKEAECPIGHELYLERGGLYYAPTIIINYGRYQNSGDGFKVVAQSPNLSIPNIPYVEVEEDVEQLAENRFPSDTSERFSSVKFNELRIGFIEGYKAASAKKWSDKELKECMSMMWFRGIKRDGNFDTHYNEIIQSLQPKIKSIEIEVGTEYYVNKEWKSVLLPSEWDDTNPTRQVPVTYQKGGKTFLKVKTVTYD